MACDGAPCAISTPTLIGEQDRMTDFAMAWASDLPPRDLALSCARQLDDEAGHTVGFVYVTSPLADSLGTIADVLQAETGIASWVGTVGVGVCTTGQAFFGQRAVTVLTVRLPDEQFRLLSSISDPEDVGRLARPEFGWSVGIVHGDPRNRQTPEIITQVASHLGTFLVGGLTAADDAFPQLCGRLVDGGVSGVLIGPDVGVSVGLSQGCSPIGPSHSITRGSGNFVIALDEMPALQVLTEDLGVADGVDPMPWLRDIHVALPVSGSDNGNYLVRNLMGIEPKQNIVVVAERVSPGDRLMFVRRDEESATKDLSRMIEDLKSRMTVAPKAGLYFSCSARGPNLFEDGATEVKAIQEAFGDIPLAGFFGNGEISNDRVYGYTGVLTLFY